MATFWEKYLLPSGKPTRKRREEGCNHVVFCPTDEWHRQADTWRPGTPPEKKPILTGVLLSPATRKDRRLVSTTERKSGTGTGA